MSIFNFHFRIWLKQTARMFQFTVFFFVEFILRILPIVLCQLQPLSFLKYSKRDLWPVKYYNWISFSPVQREERHIVGIMIQYYLYSKSDIKTFEIQSWINGFQTSQNTELPKYWEINICLINLRYSSNKNEYNPWPTNMVYVPG